MINELVALIDKIEDKRRELLLLISELDRLSSQCLVLYELESEYDSLSSHDVSFMVNAKDDHRSTISKLRRGNENLYKGVKAFKAIYYKYNCIYNA